MDGTSHTVQIDNASNAKEVTDQVYSFIGLKDRFGFALYIAMKDKVKYTHPAYQHSSLLQAKFGPSFGANVPPVPFISWQLNELNA